MILGILFTIVTIMAISVCLWELAKYGLRCLWRDIRDSRTNKRG